MPDTGNDDKRTSSQGEEGVVVPFDQINPETLRNLIDKFVLRAWDDLADAGHSHETKIEQVLQQLKNGKAKIVFDLTTETCNIVPGGDRT